jgi:hypothetical protein
MSVEVTIQVMKNNKMTSQDTVSMTNEWNDIWNKLKESKAYTFKSPLKKEEKCKEIVYINGKNNTEKGVLIWARGLDEKWVEFNLKTITLKEGYVFEIRMD